MKQLFLSLLFIGVINTYAQSYPEMITVEGGTFTMGDTAMKGGKYDKPTHQVTLNSFKIAKTETTVAQWKTFCEDKGIEIPSWKNPKGGWGDDYPISNIGYQEAIAYCEWLSNKTGKLYRLPTEEEWEYAAKGGKLSKGTKYSGSQNLEEVGWFIGNCRDIKVVAQKLPNELGIYDMSGNVCEWCMDWYRSYEATAQINPTGGKTGYNHVLRGGGWDYSSSKCTVVKRDYGSTRNLGDRGFRVVQSL
jgi:sulfatase modifying factor 1